MPLCASLAVSRKEQLSGKQIRRNNLCKQTRIHGGKIYESPESVNNIPSFVKIYNIQLDEWLGPNIHKYHRRRTLPARRKFKPGTCPFENVDNTRRSAVQLTDDIPDRQPLEKFRIRRNGFSISSLLVWIPPVLSVKVRVMVLSPFSA